MKGCQQWSDYSDTDDSYLTDRYYDGDQNELFETAHIVNPNSELNTNKHIKVTFDCLFIF